MGSNDFDFAGAIAQKQAIDTIPPTTETPTLPSNDPTKPLPDTAVTYDPSQFDFATAVARKQQTDTAPLTPATPTSANPITGVVQGMPDANSPIIWANQGATPANKYVAGPDAPLARADIGLSNNFDAKKAKFDSYFKQQYPDSDLKQAFEPVTKDTRPSDALRSPSGKRTEPAYIKQYGPDTTGDKQEVLYFKMNKDDPYIKFSKTTAQSIQDLGKLVLDTASNTGMNIAHDTLNDEADPDFEKEREEKAQKLSAGYKQVMMNLIADNSGDIPGALLGMAASGAASKLGMLVRVLATGIGSGTGEGLTLGSDALRGYTVKNPDGSIEDATTNGAAAAAGGEAFAKVLSWLPQSLVGSRGGQGIYSVDEAGRRLIAIQKELNLPMLMPHQVLQSNQGLTHLVAQVSNLSSNIMNAEHRQVAAAFNLARTGSPVEINDLGFVTKNSYEDISSQLDAAFKRTTADLDRSLNPRMQLDSTTPRENPTGKEGLPMAPYEIAGHTADAGIDEYSRMSQQWVSALYANAEHGIAGGARFDVSGPLGAINAARAGETIAGRPVQGPNGQFTRGPAVNTQPEISPQLDRIFQNIEQVLPSALTTDAISNFRQQLFDYMHTNPLGMVADSGTKADVNAARSVWRSLGTMMDNPVNLPPGAMAEWKRAQFEAQRRFGNLDFSKVVQIAKSGQGDAAATLEGYAKSLTTNPQQLSNLRQLQKILTPDQFSTFGQAFEDELRNLPSSQITDIIGKLQQSPAQRKILWGDNYWNNVIKPFGEMHGLLDRTNIEAVTQTSTTGWNTIVKLLNPGTTSAVDDPAINMIKKITGDITSPAGQSIRAGIIDHILDAASIKGIGSNYEINGAALRQALTNARNQNYYQFLHPQDIRNLEGVAAYMSGVRPGGGGEMAASLSAASEYARIRKFEGEALLTFAKAKVLGRLFASPAGARIFYGSSTTASKDPAMIRTMVAGLEQLTRNREAEGNDTPSFAGKVWTQTKKLFGGQ